MNIINIAISVATNQPTNQPNNRTEAKLEPSTSGQTALAATKSNTFNMRMANLEALNQATSTATNRSLRMRQGCVSSTSRSLNSLRQALQPNLNQEIHDIIQRYIHLYFKPATKNIRENHGETSVSENHVNAVCRQILDEAKKMF